MMRFLRSKRETSLWIAAALLLMLVAGYVIYAINFLGAELNAALSGYSSEEPLITRFDLDKVSQVLSGKSATPTPTP